MAHSPCPPLPTVRQASEIAKARQSPQKGDPGRPFANDAARGVIGGGLKRADRRRIFDDSNARGRPRSQARTAGTFAERAFRYFRTIGFSMAQILVLIVDGGR
jgi:hypothetical protein